ncbi:cysteine hydrolase [Paenibacillus albiflavus]|uniref:Cysteine hydrolase n=1 Tax=Paenibacillus albiflavus TaxID=2545760 RepID=A0A4R4EGR4_9BACL|nr:cysteine hydrolase family protein [Paenibacillus albiflavus]TCZ79276.1 cysteine hydrolase [Paenibacillus albiflavus]
MSGNTALLVIDVQVAMFNESDPVFQGELLLTRIQKLIAEARSKGIPIFYIQHNSRAGTPLEHGTTGWHIHQAIAPEHDDIVIQKKTPDSFYQTSLQQELDSRGIRKLVLTGIQTEVCVDTTCRNAYSLGYHVTLIRDAHSTWNTEELTAAQIINHHNRVLSWFSDHKSSDEDVFE